MNDVPAELNSIVKRTADLMPKGALFDAEFCRAEIDAGEYEIALDVVCVQLYEYSVPLDPYLHRDIERVSLDIGYDPEMIRKLSEILIK